MSDLYAQPVKTDSVDTEPILLGMMDKDSIAKLSWYVENYELLEIPKEVLDAIHKSGEGVEVEVYFGSWCDDSQIWVPPFMLIMDQAELSDVRLVGVPRSLEGRDSIAPGKNIEKVPTFVFIKNDVEIGRIIEQPELDLETEIIEILSNK